MTSIVEHVAHLEKIVELKKFMEFVAYALVSSNLPVTISMSSVVGIRFMNAEPFSY